MTTIPQPGTGTYYVGNGHQLLIGREYRTGGQEVPEAWDWPGSALHAHLARASLVFVAKPGYDVGFPRKLLELFTKREIADLCAAEALDCHPRATKDELIERLLRQHGYAPAEPPPVMDLSPAPRAPEPPASLAPPAPAPIPGRPDAVEVLRSMSINELRTNVCQLYGITVDPEETREHLVERIIAAAGLPLGAAPLTPSTAAPAPPAAAAAEPDLATEISSETPEIIGSLAVDG